VSHPGRRKADLLAEGVEPSGANGFQRPLGNDVAALPDADHASRLLHEIGRLGPHPETEPRIAGRAESQKVQKVPLRHEGDELAARGQVAEVRDGHGKGADQRPQLADFLVGQLEKRVEPPELVHELERGRVDGVAPEVAQEVRVLFQDEDVDARAGEERAQHHARGAAPRDAAADRITRRWHVPPSVSRFGRSRPDRVAVHCPLTRVGR
jgi:hypothetical protein